MVDTRWLYTALVMLMGVERWVELTISRRNQRWLLAHGAVEAGAGHYRWMVLLHGLFLAGCLAEVWIWQRPFHPALASVMMFLLVGSLTLRYWVMVSLGRRWSTRVFRLPGEPLITDGPFRYMRHPNYLAVVTEMLALPMLHTAWVTATVFSLANGLLLKERISVEEEALNQ